MPTQITLLTELSREKLLELRDEIDALLGSPAPTAAAPASTSNDTVEEMARRLRGRTGSDLQKLVLGLVKHYPSGMFTWEDAAARMNVKMETLKSWHRSLSKPLNRLSREFPNAPALMTGHWDGKRNQYTLSKEWVNAIKAIWP